MELWWFRDDAGLTVRKRMTGFFIVVVAVYDERGVAWGEVWLEEHMVSSCMLLC